MHVVAERSVIQLIMSCPNGACQHAACGTDMESFL